QRSLCRRVAKMRPMRRVHGSVVEHRIERCGQWLEVYNPGKHCAIANFGVDQECRTLRNLERMKFRRRCANALFNLVRTRELEQLFPVTVASRCSYLGVDFPIADVFPLAERGVGERQTNAIISET